MTSGNMNGGCVYAAVTPDEDDRMKPTPRIHAVRPAVLAAALAFALATGTVRANEPASPTWPIVGERSEQETPLRAKRDAWRRIAANHVSASRPAAIVPVTTCADDGSAGSLRNVLTDAVSGDTVDLSALTCSTITLTDGALVTEADDVRLLGSTARRLTIDGNAQDRVLLHFALGTLTIENLDIVNGRQVSTGSDIGYAGCIGSAQDITLVNSNVRNCTAIGVGSYGGAIVSDLLTMRNSTITGNTAFGDHPTNTTASYGGGVFVYGVDILDSTISGNIAKGTDNFPLTHFEIGGGLFIAGGGRIERSTIADNLAYRYGGGLANEDDVTIINSTISGNVARQDTGGGLRIRRFTSLTLENSTVANNTAGSAGGGVFFADQAFASSMRSSIVADNIAPISVDMGSGESLVVGGGNNLVETRGLLLTLPADTLTSDPLLLPLANNGGPTRTHALAFGSPALNGGSNTLNLATDQRGPGFARTVNGGIDIGAYELTGLPYVPPQPVPTLSAWWLGLLALLAGSIGIQRFRLRER
ncbi:MAG: right-handed parallel beta-helix repeat-containing protein [Dokdonella sp.]